MGQVRAGVYARISLDRHDGAGVDRQLEDGLALAEKRGWEVVDTYVDNSITAFRNKRRPEWDRLLADVSEGRVNTIVCFHSDRTYRRMRDLEDLIDLVEDRHCQIATVLAGDMDLSTPAGRKQARDWASWNRYHVEHMAEQVSRERRQRAAAGKPPCGGVRPFGYATDKVTLVPKEAKLIAKAAAEVAAGGSMFSVAERWNQAGVTTARGKPWEVSAVRRVLTSPRIAGLRVHKGEVVGDALWPAIIDQATHDRIVAMVKGRKRGRPSKGWLLSGLIGCPKCGRVMYGSATRARSYKCAPGPVEGRGCGGASVSAAPVDAKVLAAVGDWLADPPAGLEKWLKGTPGPDLSDELGRIRERRAVMAEQYAAGALDDDDFRAGLATLNRRRSELEEAEVDPRPGPNVRALADAWHRATVENQRQIVQGIIQTPMRLTPGTMADPADRLEVLPRWNVTPDS